MTTHTETLRASSDGRLDRLATQARQIRHRASLGDPHRLLLMLGGALMPIGVLLILLGWAGASRTPLMFEQVDYMISGGLLGLGLVVLGGFLYFAYWQTASVRAAQAERKQLTDALGRIEALLAGGATVQGTAAPTVPAAAYVATESGTMFHRADCVVVADRANLVKVDAATTSLRPCKLCDPLADQ
jgi:hypothetical protein